MGLAYTPKDERRLGRPVYLPVDLIDAVEVRARREWAAHGYKVSFSEVVEYVLWQAHARGEL